MLLRRTVTSGVVLTALFSAAVPAPAARSLQPYPTVAPPRPGRITWYKHLYHGFTLARDQKKPLVVLFTAEWVFWGNRLEQHALLRKEILDYADKAIFVRQDPAQEDDKGNVAKILKDLKIERYPVVVVLDVAADRVQERDRIVGYFGGDDVVKYLRPMLEAAPFTPVANAPAPREVENLVDPPRGLVFVRHLEKLLKDSGYQARPDAAFKTAGKERYLIDARVQGRPVTVQVGLSDDGEFIWFRSPLIRVADAAKAGGILAKLPGSHNVEPASFRYDSGAKQLMLSTPLHNFEVTLARFQDALEKHLETARLTHPIWDPPAR